MHYLEDLHAHIMYTLRCQYQTCRGHDLDRQTNLGTTKLQLDE